MEAFVFWIIKMLIFMIIRTGQVDDSSLIKQTQHLHIIKQESWL